MPTIDIPDKICSHCGGTKWYIFTQDSRTKKVCYVLKREGWIKFHKSNPDKHRTYRKSGYKQKSNKLTNTYLKELIISNSDLSFSDVPQDLIELKRKQLTLKRQIWQEAKNNQ